MFSCQSSMSQNYVADYTSNPFLDGSATDLDDSSWVPTIYGRSGVVVSDPQGDADEESFYAINASTFSHTFNSVGDSASISTSFYSDSTTGSGSKESTVYMRLAPGVTALIGDVGDGSGNQQILLGIGTNGQVVTVPGFMMTTDAWVDVLFMATYVGNDGSGNAQFDYALTLSGGMTGHYTASNVSQPSHAFYDIVGNAYSPQFGQEGDGDAQTIYWAATPVPEPSSAALLGLAGLACMVRRRR